ncbi:hypothetical protein [Reinekea sp. G2M2-21]|uniref:hypothetical protein n=1 Tax=Reinekea sp. G2M2-21 TaxID=2788942 RepID=UPI0018ABAEBE|nr:hypothetical protein [Reinekea sp. G2M2-21]
MKFDKKAYCEGHIGVKYMDKSRLLVLLVLVITCILASFSIYLGSSVSDQESSSAYHLWLLVSPFLVGLWLRLDLRENQYPYDYGVNFSAFRLVVLPYYLVQTRGKVGVLAFVGLFAVILLPGVVADITLLKFEN